MLRKLKVKRIAKNTLKYSSKYFGIIAQNIINRNEILLHRKNELYESESY